MRNMKFLFFSFLISLFTMATGEKVRFGGWISAESFTQKLSHFEKTNITFEQRYVVEAGDRYYKRAPIFVFLGGHASVNNYVGDVGIIERASTHFKALTVYIEHRFYGSSVPLGSVTAALASSAIRKYLNLEETLADFADVILSIKAEYSVINSPVIVVGSSYSGILAAWFRLKYPNITIGALASSAPMNYFQDPAPGNDYCSIVTQDYEQVSLKCANVIRESWIAIDEIASGTQGLEILSRIFNFCRGHNLRSLHQLKTILAGVYSMAAEYYLFDPSINRVKLICDTVLEASIHNKTVEGIARVLSSIYNGTCLDNLNSAFQSFIKDQKLAWNWQSCTEFPILRSCNGNNSIIPEEVIHTRVRHYEGCWKKYHVLPSKNWLWTPIHDHKLGSNIIFSNGLMDPYKGLGILDNVSDTIVAMNTKEGSHCQEMTKAYNSSDGKAYDSLWLEKLVEREINIFEKWIDGYNGAKKDTTSIRLLLLFLVLVFFLFSY